MEIDNTALKPIDSQEPMAEPEIIRRRKRTRSIIIFVVVSIVNAGLLTLLWVQLLTPAHPVPQNADTTVNYGTDDGLQDPMVGKPAPDFALPLLGSTAAQTLRLASLRAWAEGQDKARAAPSPAWAAACRRGSGRSAGPAAGWGC